MEYTFNVILCSTFNYSSDPVAFLAVRYYFFFTCLKLCLDRCRDPQLQAGKIDLNLLNLKGHAQAKIIKKNR